jgi:hypothetical protein
MRGIWKVLRRNPKAAEGDVKLADDFSGMGNVITVTFLSEVGPSNIELVEIGMKLAFVDMMVFCDFCT